jgi:DNA-binding XRE family transcriptional regulator
MDRQIRDRLRRLERGVGADLERLRLEAAASKAAVALAAGIDRSFYGEVERGDAHPSLETLIAVATALGGEVSVRVYSGSGPGLVDRHQARMVEALLGRLDPIWTPHLEVPVWRPVRGVIDGVFERRNPAGLVIAEFMSTITRLERQLRWSAEKAASIGSSNLVAEGPVPHTSRLLVLRSTFATRQIASQFEATLRTAYPARSRDAVRSLTEGGPWPGDAIVWVRIEGDVVELLDGAPRGVPVGR